MNRTFRPARCGLVALVALVLLAIACTNEVTPPPPPSGDPIFQGNYDPGSGELEFAVIAPNGEVVPFLRLVAREISFDAGGLLHAQVAIRNTGDTSQPGPAGVLVSHFIPNSVHPENAACFRDPTPIPVPLPGDSLPPGPVLGGCFFDHRGTYGDDGVLAGGETSAAVEWIFAGTEGQSFAFHAQLVPESGEPQGVIAGVVFHDRNANGQREPGEEGLPGLGIGLQVGDLVLIQVTDAQGHYAFEVGEPGLYRVSLTVPGGVRPTTPTELEVLLLRRDDGSLSSFLHADFGCLKSEPPTDLVIQGTVFLDLDRDGERDRNESGIPGVGINASSLICLSPIAVFTRTDANGNYVIRGAAIHCPLPWGVQRLPVEGFVGTTPDHVVLEQPPPDGHIFHVDFGVAPADSTLPVFVTIEGFVFVDVNLNGHRDTDDPPVADADVQLGSLCTVLRATRTNRQGYYRFDPGVVSVCPVTSVWQSSPSFPVYSTPNPFEVQLPTVPGFYLLRVNFGVGRDPK